MVVSLFENSFYSYGITLSQRWDKKLVLTLNARNDHDRSKFVEDLRESIAEMDEMEALRIEAELEKQHAASSRVSVGHDNRDSGVNDCDSAGVEAPSGQRWERDRLVGAFFLNPLMPQRCTCSSYLILGSKCCKQLTRTFLTH